MVIFQVPERSFLCRIDPRVRVLAAAVLSIVVALSDRPAVLAAATGGAVVLALLAGVAMGLAVRNLRELNFLMVLLACFLPLAVAGEPVVRIGSAAWSREGFGQALTIAVRANAIMIALTALLGTMEPAHLGFALQRLGAGAKGAHILLFMIRYVEVIHQEYHRLRDAMRLRAFRPRFSRHTFRTLGYLVGLLVVRSIDRSERILAAMKCRGFRGRFHLLTPLRPAGRDAIFAAAVAGCVAALSWMQWCG